MQSVPVADALVSTVLSYLDGWEVDFSTDPDTRAARHGKQRVQVPAERLVVGLLATSGDPHRSLPATEPPYAKTFTLLPAATPDNPVMEAYTRLERAGAAPRGFMYWSIAGEAASESPFYMSTGLAAVLATNNSPTLPRDGPTATMLAR